MDKNNENNKFGSIFSNINAVLNNRKKESSKTYFKKPTLKSILLTISLVVVVAIFYFQYLSDFHVDVTNMNNTQVYINICKHKKHFCNLKINLKVKQKIYFLVN